MNNTLILRVQEEEHNIMQQIIAICRRHNLTYFAIGGTAVGAVRHQGFIPWDDDIDIAMPRKDYDRFLKYAAAELPAGYHLQHFHTEPASPFYFTKIRRDNTLFVEYYLRDLPIHHGIFVDIFPFDNVPVNPIIRKLHYHSCWFFYQLFLAKSLSTVLSSCRTEKATYKSFIRKTLHVFLTPIPKHWLFNLLDWGVQLFNSRDTEEISHIVRKRLRVKLCDLYPIRYLPFNEYEIPVPNNYDAYLRAQFGQYDILPPENKRHSHLPYRIEFDSQEDS